MKKIILVLFILMISLPVLAESLYQAKPASLETITLFSPTTRGSNDQVFTMGLYLDSITGFGYTIENEWQKNAQLSKSLVLNAGVTVSPNPVTLVYAGRLDYLLHNNENGYYYGASLALAGPSGYIGIPFGLRLGAEGHYGYLELVPAFGNSKTALSFGLGFRSSSFRPTFPYLF